MGNTMGHPMEHPMRHPMRHPVGHSVGHPMGHQMGHPMGYPMGHPMGYPMGHQMRHQMGHPMGNSMEINWVLCPQTSPSKNLTPSNDHTQTPHPRPHHLLFFPFGAKHPSPPHPTHHPCAAQPSASRCIYPARSPRSGSRGAGGRCWVRRRGCQGSVVSLLCPCCCWLCGGVGRFWGPA